MHDSAKKEWNVLLAGVGGQGVVLASRVLASAAIKAGYSVKTSETIGMAQREGSVASHVRIGEEIWSPLISSGQADLLVGLEPAEAVRSLSFLKKGGLLLVNTEAVIPITVAVGLSSYNEKEIMKHLEAPGKTFAINASALARRSGGIKTLNTVMLGAIAALNIFPFPAESIFESLAEMVPEKTVQLNREAFLLGQKAIDNQFKIGVS